MGYGEACIMHLTPGVVHNIPKAIDVFLTIMHKKTSQNPIQKQKGATLGMMASRRNNI